MCHQRNIIWVPWDSEQAIQQSHCQHCAERTDGLKNRDQAILYLLYYSGIRAQELVTLNIQDISLRERRVRVLGKGNKERIVPFSADCQAVLKKYIDTDR